MQYPKRLSRESKILCDLAAQSLEIIKPSKKPPKETDLAKQILLNQSAIMLTMDKLIKEVAHGRS